MSIGQLAPVETMGPLEIFGSGSLDGILSKIAQDAKSQEMDISSEHGRKELASLAYKIARSKTFIDDLGKKLGEDAQKQINAINSERKKAREFLDSLKDEIRKPLTDWENLEKGRLAAHETEIARIIEIGRFVETSWQTIGQELVMSKIAEIKSIDRIWQEFASRADKEISITLSKLDVSLKQIKSRDEERAELERLRTAEAVRLQNEREQKIAFDAAQSAKQAAEKAAKAEAERVAIESERVHQNILKEKKAAEEKIEAAKREKLEIEKRAKEIAFRAEAEKKRAVEAERNKIELEKQAALDAEKKREANKKHAAKINNAILSGLIAIGLSEESGKSVITAILSGKIPNVKITY